MTMSYVSQAQIAWEMFKMWVKETFGGGVYFPTAPGYQQGYVK